jgi:hypothetical protein
VRFAGALHIPDDEACLLTVDAATAGIAELAARRAGLDPLRVVRADWSDLDAARQPSACEEQ